jgi:SAM-dependent methyltransferase
VLAASVTNLATIGFMSDTGAHTLEAYEAMADTYAPEVEDQSAWNSLYERPAMIAMLPDVTGKRVLDVGCGTGPISAWVASHGAEVTGFDLSPSMIRLAEKRAVPNASFRVADLSEPLSFLEDRSFDVAVASLAFHYLRDWASPLRELRRVLRPDGLFLMSTHHPAWDIELSATGNYFETELVHDRWAKGRDREEFDVHFWRRPLSAMFAAFEQAGFEVRSFVEPLPIEECRTRFPDDWERLTTKPLFALFKLGNAH